MHRGYRDAFSFGTMGDVVKTAQSGQHFPGLKVMIITNSYCPDQTGIKVAVEFMICIYC